MKTWLGKIRLWELSLAVFLGFGCYFLWGSLQTERQVASKTVAVLSHADSTLTGFDHTLGTVNSSVAQIGGSFGSAASSMSEMASSMDKVVAKLLDNCHPEKGHIYSVDEDKPCGTLADIARTLHTIRGTFGVVESAGKHYNDNLTKYDKQESDLIDNTNDVLSKLSDTIDYAHQLAVAHEKFLDNLQRLAGNSADTMEEVHGVVKDIHVQTTKMNQPKTRQQRILEWMPVIVKGAISTACMATGAC